jgi:ribonuclease HII
MSPDRKAGSPDRDLLFEYDLELGSEFVVGADEAGRGCLAGPIVAAGVAFDRNCLVNRGDGELEGLFDSKRLTPTRRKALFPKIVATASRVRVVMRSAAFIDRYGIQRANIESLTEAVAGSADLPDATFLIDGFSLGPDAPEHRRVVKGDATSATIAAASVIAKVIRDGCMERASILHPEYGFDGHKGYGSEAHREAIASLGPTPIHRLSFRLTDDAGS